ncbi:MAG: Gfo/Idh/MocA family oxidoreductase [Planctomycetes bacterium]|nr:Gfo/Idh/MocA family oxidoreductase [Planctomycetota bacterium]
MEQPPRITGLHMKQDPRQEPVRICVIGARRVRNGTGPFLARQVVDAGAELCAVLGTTSTTTRTAVRRLAADGYETDGYTSFEAMVNETRPDGIVIATPAGTHRPWLESCLLHELHTFCEKPLLSAFDQEAAILPYRFAAMGRVLVENCQWPFTLAAFRQLHPDVDLAKVSRFRMMLAPEFRGLSRWIETMSHPLSLLQTAAPGPAELEDLRFQESGPDAPDSRLNFVYKTVDRSIECEILLADTGERPRTAEYAWDDHVCRRRIVLPEYEISFDDGFRLEGASGEAPERGVKAEDPQVLCVQSFLQQVYDARSSGSAPAAENIARRQRLLSQILAAYAARCRT